MKKYYTICSLMLLLFLWSCSDFVKIDPPQTQIVTADVFASDATATSAMLAIYEQMIENADFATGAVQSVTALAGLSSDELVNYATDNDLNNFNLNSLTSATTTVRDPLWAKAYTLIYYSNSILEGLASSTTISKPTSQQLQGEAKFIRAFCYFYLVNLFGDVPLIAATDYRQNISKPRALTSAVYDQITQDLIDASALLSAGYQDGERVRPNSSAATALLSRVYLYTGQWLKAENAATSVLTQSDTYKLVSVDSIFLANSGEALWQLMPVTDFADTWEGNLFILQAAPIDFALRDEFKDAFEPGDLRKTSWLDSIVVDDATYYFPFKYKIQYGPDKSEYSTVLRLGEVYLIRSEARMQQGNLSGAKADLNVIRSRAGLPGTAASDNTSMALAIEQERKIELFTEWGHRWLDLKRTSRADAILGPLKGTTWQPTDVLYPIPQTEIATDPALTQNPGY